MPEQPLPHANLFIPVMGSLRMMKLFGWESLVKDEAAKKREEELKWVWRNRLLEIFNGILKCVPSDDAYLAALLTCSVMLSRWRTW